ncbi:MULTISPECIES: hypothetical protein [Halorubrum]|uniref:hypothetical protein n=1 Tax=Halorubrum TaxID=56688 RepID=UPI0010F4EDF1|nr:MULTISPECIES: hypothetical protein [Halorubrum]MDB2225768.1 hypothetical protein [Halorubrum ezzemoulense]MDB2249836.1 hypothetical protein [Halorubrum ezzemoulense]TKX38123.1 hypothetical protein EXE52_13970 [Halorubrum sp. CGM4_25_10-8A]
MDKQERIFRSNATDEGFDIFHGREYISFRTDSHLAPNSTVVEQHLKGKEAVILAYNEANNEVALIPLSADYDRGDVYSLKRSDGSTVIAATGFFKEHDLSVDQTIRYSPEWNGDIGGDNVPGGLVIDLDEDGEIYAAAHHQHLLTRPSTATHLTRLPHKHDRSPDWLCP